MVSNLGACQGGRSQVDAPGSAEPCPQVPASTYVTQVVRAQFTPMQLRLPAGAFQSQDFVDELEHSQAWVDSSGLLVSYTVQREPPLLRNPSSGDRDVVNCSETIGGRPAVIRMLYSGATTAPGQRVIAVWKLESGEALILTAFHPDRNRRNELLNIVRSANFGG